MALKMTKADLESELMKAQKRIAELESQGGRNSQAEVAQRHTEIYYRALFEQTHDAVFIMDLEGNHLAANQRAAELLGYKAHELPGLPISVTSAQVEQSREVTRRLLNGENIPIYERIFRKKDGSTVLTDVNVELVKDVDGKPLHIQSVVRDITERKLVEDALKKSEMQYRLLADNMNDIVWLMDMDLQVFYISPSTEKIQGYTLAELRSMTLEEQLTPESYERAMALYTEVLSPTNLAQPNADMAYDIDLEFYRKDGTTYWSRNSFKLILDKNGKPVSILGLGHDITNKKIAEDNLRKSEERYRIIAEDMPALICRFLADGTLTFVNSFYCNYFNTQYEDLVGSNLFQLMLEAEKAFVKSKFLSLDQKRPFITYEHKTLGMDGKEYWQRWTDRALFNEKGEVMEYQSIGEDITERKQTEQQLAESEARLRALIANSGDLIVVIDAEGKITFASPSSEHIFGYKPEDAIGRNFMEWLHPEDYEEALAALQSRRQTSGTALQNIQVRGLHKDGSWRYVEALGTNLIDDPAIKGIVLNIRDVTEQKHAELERQIIYEIMQGVAFSHNLGEFLGLVHYSIGRIIRADNFFVSLHNPSTGFFDDVYCVDQFDEVLEPSRREGSLTSYIFRTGNPLLATDEKFKELIALGEVQLIGVDSKSWIGVPLKTAGKTIGVMAIQDYATAGLYSEKDLAFLASISGQVASAVERKKAEEILRESENRYRLLFDTMMDGFALHEIICDKNGKPCNYRFLEVNPSFEQMTGIIAAEIIGKTVLEAMPDTEAYWVETYGKVAQQGEAIRFENYSRALEKYYDVVAFSPKKNQFATLFKDITQRKKAEAEISRQVAELETLYESGLAISRLLTPKEIAQKVIEILDRRMNWHHIAIRQYESETNSVKLLAFNRPDISTNEAEEFITKMNKIISTPNQGLSGWVTLNGRSIRVPDVKNDPRYIEVFPEIQSGVYVPIMIGERVIGSISVESEKENAFTETDARLLETLAGQAAIAIENANLFQTTQREIVERQHAEAALQHQAGELLTLNNRLEQRVKERTAEIEVTRKRLQLAASAAGLGIWEWDNVKGLLIWDAQMYHIYDTSPEEFGGKLESVYEYILPEDQIIMSEAAYGIVVNHTTSYQIEYRIQRKNGEIRTLTQQGVAVFDEYDMLDRIIGTVNDITPQKKAEQALRESEAYARLLFESAPDSISVADVEGNVIDVNRLFEIQHQVKREEIRGRHLSELNIFPAEELAKIETYLAGVIQGKGNFVEINFYNPGGGTHTLEMSSYPIEVQGRQLIVNTTRDITLHKKAEDSLRLANAEMERALHVKDEFLANMSHELRTPLNAVLGMSESLEEQIAGPLNDKQLKYIRTINESGKHLLELINDILDLSKIEAGRMELNVSQVSVSSICEASMRMVKEQALKKNQEVSLKIDPEVKIIMGDERRLKQALVNLLSNAVKFTPNDRRVGVEVKGNNRNQTVTFSVWDEGIGMAPDQLNLIFKPFVQLDAGLAREFSGTGLGLVLVAQMIRLHGGSVSVESKEGQGSIFSFTLPWVDVEGIASAKKQPQKTEAGPTSEEKRGEKILIVEDTDSIIMLLSEYLHYKGYEIIVAHNGMEGVILAAKEKPDLILMDVMMPVMDGVEATQQIRAEKDLQEIPIIALTALAMSGDKERCLQAGMNDYISKPVQMKELEALILKHIHKSKGRAAPLS